MSKNMKEHCHLHFDTGVDAILKLSVTISVFTRWLKGDLFILSMLSLYIVVVLDIVKICRHLAVTFKHGSICEHESVIATSRSMVDQKHPYLNQRYDGNCLNENLHSLHK
jgi:hypothetical protein